MNENMAWIKELKIGDKIAVDISSTWMRNNYKICTVEKITPTGRIKLSDGSQYQPDGKQIGTSYSYPLRQITPAILDIIKRRQLISKIDIDKFIGLLSVERLEILLQWQTELLEQES